MKLLDHGIYVRSVYGKRIYIYMSMTVINIMTMAIEKFKK